MWTEIIVMTMASGISLISHPTDHGFYATQDECETAIFKKFQRGDLEGKKLERTHHDKTQLIVPMSGGEVVRECVELKGYEQISEDTIEKAQADAQRRKELAEAFEKAEAEARALENAERAKHNTLDAMTTRITRSWRRPVTYQGGREVYLRLSLASNGELVDVRIIKPSGDVVFDRSALNAVERAAPFDEVEQFDEATFEEAFRSLTVKFRPEN